MKTNLPLRELKFHLSATLSGQTRLFLERPPHDSSGDGQILVVAVISPLAKGFDIFRIWAHT